MAGAAHRDDVELDDVRSARLEQVPGGDGRATRGEHVVDEKHPLAACDGVRVDLDRGRAVLEVVGARDRVAG